jgi:hypothetical protein
MTLHVQAPERHAVLSRTQIARITFVFVLGSFALARTLPDSMRIFAPLTVFGYYTDSSGKITGVVPRSPAAKVGLRVGDRVDVRDFPVADRKGGLIGKTYSAYNPLRHMTVVRDGVRMSYEIKGVPEGYATRVVILLRELVAFVTISIGMLLAIVRPSRATLGFFHFVIGGEVYPNTLTSVWLDYPWRMVVDGVNDVLVSGAAIGLLMFAIGFPRDRVPRRWRFPVDACAGAVWAVGAYLFLHVDVGSTYFARSALHEAHVYAMLQTALVVAAMGTFVVTLIRARGPDQIRVAAVVVAFLIAIGGYLAAEHLYPGPLKYWQYVGLEALPILPAIAVAYGATRYHIMGVDFLVNRALVYAAMTAAIAGIVALIEEGFSYWFVMNTNLAYAIIIAITMSFGAFFGRIRDAVRYVVDRLMFRDRLQAHATLEMLAREIPRAGDRDRIEYALTAAVQQAFRLRCAALFEPRGDHFTVVAGVHWPPGVARIAQNDPTMQRILRNRVPETLHERDWIAWSQDLLAVTPRIALPIGVDAGPPLVAIYGLELSGVDLDPDEIRTLERLGAGAAIGFSNLRTKELVENLDELTALRAENARLRRRIAELEDGARVSPVTEAPLPPGE